MLLVYAILGVFSFWMFMLAAFSQKYYFHLKWYQQFRDFEEEVSQELKVWEEINEDIKNTYAKQGMDKEETPLTESLESYRETLQEVREDQDREKRQIQRIAFWTHIFSFGFLSKEELRIDDDS